MLRHFRIVAVASAVLILASGLAMPASAACTPQNLSKPAPRDPVARVLTQQEACPKTAIAFRNLLKRSGARLEPTMVNFVGFHNPDPGAFFVFEIVSTAVGGSRSQVTIDRGDLVFGHFTGATDDGRLVANTDGLVIELIAWDPDKQFYNFYELVDGSWFYRGDSKDILDDIRLLHRQRTTSERAFGQRLRCSGCHVSGGLLQKELASPHNDWSLKTRQLSTGALKPDASVKEILAELVDGEELSKIVAVSAHRLANSPGYRKLMAGRSMQEQLRPLFCPVDVNIESDIDPFDTRKPAVRIPSGFFVDPRLATVEVVVRRQAYDTALKTLGSRLPNTPGRVDADHAWLAPVKAQSDIVAVEALIEQGIVDREFVVDVLAIDFTSPAFASRRCDLLKFVPDKAGPNFVVRFEEALRGAAPPRRRTSHQPDGPRRNTAFHRQQALAFVTNCQQRSRNAAAVLGWSRLLAQRRVEVSASEISKNGANHILEDPKRVVFPSTTPSAKAGRLLLTTACQVQ